MSLLAHYSAKVIIVPHRIITMKLVHWPLMCGLLHLVQPIHQRPVYQSPYFCIMVRCSAVLMCPLRV